MKFSKIISLLALGMFVFSSCGDDEAAPTTTTLNSSFDKLENLGDGFAYEGWLIVDGTPVSTGVFTVDAQGAASKSAFEVEKADLEAASAFVLTIEPSPDNDPAPTDVHILGGDISGTSANLTISHGAALGTSFTGATGNYILATPTDDDDTNEKSGVWFIDNSSGMGLAGLDLPALPAAGWAYEGWAVIDGTPISTGTFTTASGADDSAPFSGPNSGPPYPGEDFLNNQPTGLNFPTDLSNAKIVVSIEPVPDNSPSPFVLKPLAGDVIPNALDHTTYSLDNIAASTYPSGTVNFEL